MIPAGSYLGLRLKIFRRKRFIVVPDRMGSRSARAVVRCRGRPARMMLSRIVWLDRILALVIPIRGIRRHLGAYSRGRVAARSAGGYSSWFLSVLQQGP